MSRARVVVADDHEDVLDTVRSLLEPEFEVVGTVSSGDRLLAAVEALQPDLVVADITMPGLSGLEAARRVTGLPRPPAIVFLSVHQSPAIVAQALSTGALGYVSKASADTELVGALNEALGGRTFVSASLRR